MDSFSRLVEILKKDPFHIETEVSPAQEIKSLNGWDSLKQLGLLIEIENTFQFELDPKSILKMRTIADLISIIENGINGTQNLLNGAGATE